MRDADGERATRSRILAWSLFAALGLMWGSQFLFIRVAAAVPPFELVALRLLFGAIVLGLATTVSRRGWAVTASVLRGLVVLAVLNNVIPFALLAWAEHSVTSGLTAALNATGPLFTIALAAFALRDEPITARRTAGLAVGFAGVIVLLGDSIVPEGTHSDLLPPLAVTAAALAFAAALVYARRSLYGVPPLIIAFGQVALACPVAVGASLLFEQPWPRGLDPTTITASVVLGVFATGVAYLIWYWLLARWGATRTSLVAYLMPVVGIALGVMFLGEPLPASLVVGTPIALFGLIVASSSPAPAQLA